MAKNPNPILKYFLDNRFFLFRVNNTRNMKSCDMVYLVKKPDLFVEEPFFKIYGHCLIKGFWMGKSNYWSWFSFFFIFNATLTLFIEVSYEILILHHLFHSLVVNLLVFHSEDKKTIYGILKQLYIFVYWINFVHYYKEIQHWT